MHKQTTQNPQKNKQPLRHEREKGKMGSQKQIAKPQALLLFGYF